MKYNIRYVHKISPSDTDVVVEELPDGCFADRNVLGKALRAAGLLIKGCRIAHFRVEGAKVVAFPQRSMWHALIIEARNA